MEISRLDVEKVGEFYYSDGRLDIVIKTVTLVSGEVLFVANDVVVYALGLQNPANLTKGVDDRSKSTVVVSFEEGVNPQRYVLVNMEGLRDIVYRARKSEVNKLDFILWAQEKSVN